MRHKIVSTTYLILMILSLQACALMQGLIPGKKTPEIVTQETVLKETATEETAIETDTTLAAQNLPPTFPSSPSPGPREKPKPPLQNNPLTPQANDTAPTANPVNRPAGQSTDFAFQKNQRYQKCLSTVEADVGAGRAAANQWVNDGGGSMAIHCLSVADLAAGFPKLSALRLQELADTPAAGDILTRARLYAQSSEIWLSAGQTEEARVALDSAFQLAPDAGELFLLAGKVNVANQRWQPTIEAITKAEELGFFTSEGYTARGRAYKELTQFNDSAEDVARALSLDAFNLDALVLRGELAQTGITINTRFRRVP